MAASESKPNPYPAPIWAWCLAVATYPFGFFVLYSATQLIRWQFGMAALLVTCLLVYSIDATYGHFPEDSLVPDLLWAGYIMAMIGLGFWLYRLGARCGYWSERAVKVWRIARLVGLVSLAMHLFSMLPLEDPASSGADAAEPANRAPAVGGK